LDGVDVWYVLGGRERNLELIYVRAHVELARGSRGRRRDEKMNLPSLGRGEQVSSSPRRWRTAACYAILPSYQ
jgi:hypothetical protein